MKPLKRRKAFTLVELLVVMGIIAILGAVSIGTYNAVIKTSQAAKCASNMHQIAIGFQGYLGDNNNVMPQRVYKGGSTNVGYFDLLAPYTGDNLTDKATSVFVCPSHTACSFPSEPSYGMNYNYDNVSITAVTNQANTILLAETLGVNGDGSNRAQYPSSDGIGKIDPTRHNGVANYLFFDGHIEKLPLSAVASLWGEDMGNHSAANP